MNDRTTALVYLAAAGAVFLLGWKLLAKKTPAALQKPQRVACLGDSITAAGYYCSDLKGILGCEAKAFGYAGQGVNAIASHLNDVLAWNPDVVVVLAGVNDLPQASGAQKAIKGLESLYARIRDEGVAVIAVEVTPWHGYSTAVGHEANTQMLNDWIRYDAVVDGRVRTTALGDSWGNLKDKYSSGDGLHLNREGHAALAVLIADQAFGK